MPRIIMLIPIGDRVGLTTISLGLIRAIELKGIHLTVFKPVIQSQLDVDIYKQTNTFMHKNSSLLIVKPLKIKYAEFLLSKNQKDILMEEITANFFNNIDNKKMTIIEGLTISNNYQFTQLLNYEISKTLSAEIIFVISQNNNNLEQIKRRIELLTNSFDNKIKNIKIIGIIINKVNLPLSKKNNAFLDFFKISTTPVQLEMAKINLLKLQNFGHIPILGMVPWNFDLIATRAIDIAYYLNASIINRGEINIRRIKSVIFCTHDILQAIKYFYTESLLIISANRSDILFAACLAATNGVKIGAILLTDNFKMNANIRRLCKRAFDTGLPIFTVDINAWQTSIKLQNFSFKIPPDDDRRIKKIQKHVSDYIDINQIGTVFLNNKNKNESYLSPLVFRHKLIELSRRANKRIILPEGNELRILKASAICAKRGIATCVLLGNPNEISNLASLHKIKLGTGIEIIDPDMIRENYISRLIELRKDKGVTEAIARKQLENNIVLSTLMLEQDEVNGLVCGIVHTTADTIRPSLQLIKTASDAELVSSIFFMLLPERVYIYGDCAINLNPTAEQLAEIAIQSANSAIMFGIEPRIAMLSYSTGNSGIGNEVEKVRKATYLAKQKRPNLFIDGPLQYDAAVLLDVAKLKAPDSPVAGNANVFIFPDLNSGNITYKAVQRSANLISIGPILQGIRKPVNDLSRGALIDDIVYTIALTAIQANKN